MKGFSRIRSHRNICGNGHAKTALFEVLDFEAGTIEKKRFDIFDVRASDFYLHRRAGGSAERRQTVKARQRQVGPYRTTEKDRRRQNAEGYRTRFFRPVLT